VAKVGVILKENIKLDVEEDQLGYSILLGILESMLKEGHISRSQYTKGKHVLQTEYDKDSDS
jgi:hypothetical protein